MTDISDISSGNHVGGPAVCIEFKLKDIPEMNYLSTDEPPRGEIMLKGPACIKEYYKDEEETKLLIDEDGWPHFKNIKKMPHLDDKEQDTMMKEAIIDYFNNEEV